MIPKISIDRSTKLLVAVWACAAMAFEVWYVGLGAPLWQFTVIAFAAAAVLAWADSRAVGLVLAFTYVFPVLVWLVRGQYVAQFGIVWLAPLLGAILPSALSTSWRLPVPWRAALVCWALVVVASGTIVAAREVDFTPALLSVSRGMANSLMGGLPGEIAEWVLYVSLVQVVGILWFDWVLGLPLERFRAAVATPMAASALVLIAVANYQLFVDMSFLNATVFRSSDRASATMQDANVAGTIAALWIGGWVLWATTMGRFRWPVMAMGSSVCWLAVWATGSRTAFAAAVVVTLFGVRGLYGGARERVGLPRSGLVAAALAGLVVALIVSSGHATGPFARFQALPSMSPDSILAFVQEQVWIRNGYGTAASAMVRQYPWFGVGVGAFQSLLPEFAGTTLSPDNAQNWYRHQLAELGVIGSLGWAAWLVAFGAFVFSRRRHTAAAWSARGVLIAFGLISFVGVPGQDGAVTITFWTMAAWYLTLAGPPAPATLRPAVWAIVVAIAAVYTAGTAHAATNALRVPARAQRIGWPYEYGIHPAGAADRDGYRWTARHAVSVAQATAPWVVLTVSLDHRTLGPDHGRAGGSVVRTRPTHVKIWCDGKLIFDRELATTAAATTSAPVDDPDGWVFIETWVGRVLSPRELGIADDRELGVRIRRDFLNAPHVPEAASVRGTS